MGLTIILAIVFSCMATFGFDELHKNFKSISKLKALTTITANTAASILIALMFSFIVMIGIRSFGIAKMEFIGSKVETLQEIQPDVYVITGVQNNSRSLDNATVTVKVNGDLREVYLENSKICLNWDEAVMETRYYDFKNSILNFLLFDPKVTEHDIYVPQSSLDGAFTIK